MKVAKKVILVTDGDWIAKGAVETAARNIGARCISGSAGNPTPLRGPALVEKIQSAPREPVVVMLDDKGYHGMGRGEEALSYLCGHPEIEVLGVLAVASNTQNVNGCKVDASINCDGQWVSGPVDKLGEAALAPLQNGDTLEVIDSLNVPVVIGIGDIGKMDGADDVKKGAPLTTKALRTIMERSGSLDCG
jgi:stage V sporulation protein AE